MNLTINCQKIIGADNIASVNAILDIRLGCAKTNALNTRRKCLIWSKIRKPVVIEKFAVDYEKSKP